MKIQSFSQIIIKAGATFQRFPFVLISAITFTVVSIILIDLRGDGKDLTTLLIKMGMCSVLGITLFLSIDLFSERKNLPKNQEVLLDFAGFILLVVYFFLLPDELGIVQYIRYSLWLVGLHLLVSIIPYLFIEKTEINGFWQFNQFLFVNILTSALYSAVLYIGISIAILAVDQLFDATIDGMIYSKLWFFIVGFFNTWFFLSKVTTPGEYEELEEADYYPVALKVFTQYVLLPLVTIYLVILYAYGFKILFEWNLPKGWVTYLIIAFSTAGIFSLLLIYPIREEEENKWIKTFSKWFYLALFPLVVLLFIAIGRRLYDYGITENRYFVIVLACWLTGIAIYFLLSKTKNIQVIPISLFLIAILSSFGPWGAFYVSKTSQVYRFQSILDRNGMLENGKIIRNDSLMSHTDSESISSIVSYLVDRNELPSLQTFFSQNLDSLNRDGLDVWDKKTRITALIFDKDVVEFNNERTDIEESERNSLNDKVNHTYTFYNTENKEVNIITGYDYFLSINEYNDSDTERVRFYDLGKGKSLKVVYNFEQSQIEFYEDELRLMTVSMTAMMAKLIKQAKTNSMQADRNDLTMYDEAKDKAVKIEISNLQLERITKKENKIKNISAMIFIRVPKKEAK